MIVTTWHNAGIIAGMKLSDDMIIALKATGKVHKYSDGGGLYLHLSPVGGKLWRMGYRFERKRKTLSFGAYPAVSLEDARAKRDDAKRLLANGIDPSEQRKNMKYVMKRVHRFATEIQFMRDKITEMANLAIAKKLSLEISIGIRGVDIQTTGTELQHIGTFVINGSGGELTSP